MRTLVLGGSRSGKSAYAEALLSQEPAVDYVATAVTDPADREWEDRVATHQERRLRVIDAPEADQVCPDGWSAGVEARYLEQLVEGKQIRCIRLDGERHGEPFAVCRADGVSTSAAPWSSQDK